ncbi:MAG TPA: TetR family transcriptional regulator [Aliidongia sp.]|uniref:TetR family transcriptional regulator n=1 Tax=Aliidongia sp. TaxID=1914230 RepID=UPI002DDD2F37|nr:TetR family transcriptional regulator [Aliidongia sp.]HEV2675723.1 TetR family transcriptional regulator [Aliidongia sp.]
MARKISGSKTSSQKPVADLEGAVVDAALTLAADRSWSGLALADIAAAAEVSLADLYGVFPSKGAILKSFARRVDAAMVALPGEADATPHDRLFEVLMHRFDLLARYKPGLRGLGRDARRGRLDGLALACHLPRSLGWMLEAAGISASGLKGAVRVKLLGLAYLATVRVWLEDDSADLARTMASLDRALKRAEPFMRLRRPPVAPGGEAVA